MKGGGEGWGGGGGTLSPRDRGLFVLIAGKEKVMTVFGLTT